MKKTVARKHSTPIPPLKGVLRRIDSDLSYNAHTGIILWINPRASNIPIGSIAGSVLPQGYISIEFRYKGKRYSVRAHHVAYYKMRGVWPPRQIDHKNTVEHDNSWGNLRLAKDGQQVRNRGMMKNNTSGVIGVQVIRNKFRVVIRYRYKPIHIGYFDTLREAKRARRLAEKQYFGRFRFRGK